MSVTDPVFAVLADWRAKDEQFQIWHEELKAVERAYEARGAGQSEACARTLVEMEQANEPALVQLDTALERLYATRPTTLDGLAALVEVFMAQDLAAVLGDTAGIAIETICRGVLALRQTGKGLEPADG